MSVIATAVQALIAAGVSGDALVEAIANMEAAQLAAQQRHGREAPRRLGISAQEWRELRFQVFARDHGFCQYCGDDTGPAPQCDHVVPLSRGGETVIGNLVTACKSCNSSKRDRLFCEWVR